MIIQSSNVAMGARRAYRSARTDLVSYSGWGNRAATSTLPTAKDGVQQSTTNEKSEHGFLGGKEKDLLDDLEREQKAQEAKKNSFAKKEEGFKAKDPVEFDTFRNILEMLLGIRNYKKSWKERLQNLLFNQQTDFSMGFSLSQTEGFGVHYQETHYFEEEETTAFYSSGKVTTADGRQIEFDVSAYMSRSFMEYSNLEIDYGQVALVDPLVINLKGNTAEVRDQKFLFDLDGDGKLDNIAMLGEMSGYLALDKNEDGIINDGSELFGTKTGDGFGELAVFDVDGNGWIDENDPVFNKLRIWTKDANGNDKLVGLGIAGVGAIYTGNVSTNFSVRSKAFNEEKAEIKSTGVYLKENGEAGTIQHVDMAIGN